MSVGSGSAVLPVRRLQAAPDPLQSDLGFEYADSFEMTIPHPEGGAAEEWARAALEGVPAVVRMFIRAVHRGVLGFRLAPPGTPAHVLGWRVSVSEPDAVRLDTGGALMRATIVARRADPTRARVTTYLWFDRPVARRIWSVVGMLHRFLVPVLLRAAWRTRLRTGVGSHGGS